jgi:hypothetical protein
MLDFRSAPKTKILYMSDATLSKRAWVHIQQSFGPHDFDMFSLDSNAMLNNIGDPLAHFTPFPTPETFLALIGNPTWLPGPIMCSDWSKF